MSTSKNIIINNLRFKRVLNFDGDIKEAIDCVKTRLEPSLANGEPIIVSYRTPAQENADGSNAPRIHYFLAVGTGDSSKIRISPLFTDFDSFVSYIIKIIGTSDLGFLNEKDISSKSNIAVERDENNKYILLLKAGIVTADNIDMTYTDKDGQLIKMTQNEFNASIIDRLNKLEFNTSWKKI